MHSHQAQAEPSTYDPIYLRNGGIEANELDTAFIALRITTRVTARLNERHRAVYCRHGRIDPCPLCTVNA